MTKKVVVELTKSEKTLSCKLSKNPKVLLASGPSVENVEKWLKNVKDKMKINAAPKSYMFLRFLDLLKSISLSINKNTYLRLDEFEDSVRCSVGENRNVDNLSRTSNLAVDSGRVFIKVNGSLRIRFVMNNAYAVDFDKKMEVKDKSTLVKSYEGRLKHKNKTHVQTRDVYLELDNSLFANLNNYLCALKLTDYYQGSPILRQWVPLVFSNEHSEDEYQDKAPAARGELIDDLKDIENSDLSNSEKEALTKARIGQGKFRRDVINTWKGEKCAITLVGVKEILIASHIKAWKDCRTTEERLDGANGILLCAHVDKLFDNHLITFHSKNSRYYLKLSQSVDGAQLNGLGVETGIELDVSHLDFKTSARFKTYMEHHNQVFADKESSRA